MTYMHHLPSLVPSHSITMQKDPSEVELECEKEQRCVVIEHLVTFVRVGVGN